MNRPDWPLTEVPWEQRVVIWDQMAKGATDSEIARSLEQYEGTDKFHSRNTIGNVRKELGRLPEELADGLPLIVREFWRSKHGQAGSFAREAPLTTGDCPYQDHIRGMLIGVRFELDRFVAAFPTVFRLSFRHEDHGSHLDLVESDGLVQAKWRLSEEDQDGWNLARQHLATGHPLAFEALNRFKQSVGLYCQKLADAEDTSRNEVYTIMGAEPESPTLNESYYIRSIVGEVDNDEPAPAVEDYSLNPQPYGIEVAYQGAYLIRAKDEETARLWVDRHIQWRRDFIIGPREELIRLRPDAIAAARDFVMNMRNQFMGARIEGYCEGCGGDMHGVEK